MAVDIMADDLMADALTAPLRPVLGRPISFEDWLRGLGIDPASLPNEYQRADYIGGIVFPSASITKAQRDKLGALGGASRRLMTSGMPTPSITRQWSQDTGI